jgi:hypothetical protein
MTIVVSGNHRDQRDLTKHLHKIDVVWNAFNGQL